MKALALIASLALVGCVTTPTTPQQRMAQDRMIHGLGLMHRVLSPPAQDPYAAQQQQMQHQLNIIRSDMAHYENLRWMDNNRR